MRRFDRVLVTGGAGYVGSHAVKALRAVGRWRAAHPGGYEGVTARG